MTIKTTGVNETLWLSIKNTIKERPPGLVKELRENQMKHLKVSLNPEVIRQVRRRYGKVNFIPEPHEKEFLATCEAQTPERYNYFQAIAESYQERPILLQITGYFKAILGKTGDKAH